MIVGVVAVVAALVAFGHCLHSVINLFLIFDSFLVLVVDLLIESLRGYDAVPTVECIKSAKKNQNFSNFVAKLPQIFKNEQKLFQKFTCTLKNGPIIWTVVSSSAGAVPCSGSLIILPVTRCNSRTFWPPFPIIRPTYFENNNQTLETAIQLKFVTFQRAGFNLTDLWTRY